MYIVCSLPSSLDAMAYRGDLVSCEVDFDGAKQGRVPVVFSLNGREVARASIQYTAGQTSLFPYVAMGYEGIRVLANVRNLFTSFPPFFTYKECINSIFVTQELRLISIIFSLAPEKLA